MYIVFYLRVSDKRICQCILILHFGIIIHPAPPLTQSVLSVVHKKASKDLFISMLVLKMKTKDNFDVTLGDLLCIVILRKRLKRSIW